MNSNIHLSANDGDVAAISDHLSSGTDVNTLDQDNNTPLHLAAKNGHLAAVKILVNNGVSVNAQNQKGGTAI